MKSSFSIFLLVAESLSISQAAKRAFVTQQCVSDHIKRLEQEYGVQLFTRKPRLTLTQAGETMLNTLRSISILEQNMEQGLKGISSGNKGAFTVGMSTSRAQVILPRMLSRYHEAFPDVKIYFYVNDTVVLQQQLLEGKIDLFLGVNTTQHPDFSMLALASDSMKLIISDQLLRQHFGSRAIQQFDQGVDLAQFAQVPFALYYTTGALNKIINRHLEQYRLHLMTNYNISDCDTHIALCASGLCAALCPKALLARVREQNAACPPERFIHSYSVRNFDDALRVDLVWHKHAQLPLYIRIFMEMVQEEVDLLVRE